MTQEVRLRDVCPDDLPVLFEQQCDPAGSHMVAFLSADPRDRAAFAAKWEKIFGDPSAVAKTIVIGTEVAGQIVKWHRNGRATVGYQLGRAFWGRGIATAALSAFLEIVNDRPLCASAAVDNVGSLRVLSKCGFRITHTVRNFALARGAEIDEVFHELG